VNDLVRFDAQLPQTAASIRAHVNLIQEVMKAVMQGPSKENPDGVHYGKIPGTPKPTLFKPGAEVLCATFRIAPSYRVEDLSGADFVRYRVACVGTHQSTSVVLGEGMGECSSMEEKYKWRKSTGDREFDAASEDRKRVKHGKDWSTKQVRTEPADLANTILKMACKRAQVAMTLNVTAASDIFTQDIEDLPPELRPSADGGATREPAVQQPKSKTQAPADNDHAQAGDASGNGGGAQGANDENRPMVAGQIKILRAKLAHAGLTEIDLEAAFPGKSLNPAKDATPFVFGEFATLQAWISEHAKG